jgi:23S rRNA pseudouridine1911/1915/1917 synthase
VSGDSGDRLDRYLVREGLASSRRAAQELIASGMVRVNGRRLRKAAVVGSHDRIEIARELRAGSIEPNPDLPLQVLYQDDAVIVVNKPGGMPCHPLRSGERDTAMNAVVAKYPEAGAVGDSPREGGLVHRLDNGTSGALMVARTQEAFSVLRSAIRSGAIHRTYEALVIGSLTSRRELSSAIAHHHANPRKMTVGEAGSERRKRAGRPAATIIEPVRQMGPCTLIQALPRTGSRHQIRLHLAKAGFPIVGDGLYGGPPAGELQPGRFWLHLACLEFDSPAGNHASVIAPLPDDLRKLLR